MTDSLILFDDRTEAFVYQLRSAFIELRELFGLRSGDIVNLLLYSPRYIYVLDNDQLSTLLTYSPIDYYKKYANAEDNFTKRQMIIELIKELQKTYQRKHSSIEMIDEE